MLKHSQVKSSKTIKVKGINKKLSKELEVQKESLATLERELESIKEAMNNLDKRGKEYLALKEEFDQKVNHLLIIDENIMFLTDLIK